MQAHTINAAPHTHFEAALTKIKIHQSLNQAVVYSQTEMARFDRVTH